MPSLAGVKFLGSYPAAGPAGPALRRDAESSWTEAGTWVDALRPEVGPGSGPEVSPSAAGASGDYPGWRSEGWQSGQMRGS